MSQLKPDYHEKPANTGRSFSSSTGFLISAHLRSRMGDSNSRPSASRANLEPLDHFNQSTILRGRLLLSLVSNCHKTDPVELHWLRLLARTPENTL